jgi:hypothetical protein
VLKVVRVEDIDQVLASKEKTTISTEKSPWWASPIVKGTRQEAVSDERSWHPEQSTEHQSWEGYLNLRHDALKFSA